MQGELLQLDMHQHKFHNLCKYLDRSYRCRLLKLRLPDTRQYKYRKQYNLR